MGRNSELIRLEFQIKEWCHNKEIEGFFHTVCLDVLELETVPLVVPSLQKVWNFASSSFIIESEMTSHASLLPSDAWN